MLEFIINIVVWIVVCFTVVISTVVGWVIFTFYPIIILGLIIGIPMYLLSRSDCPGHRGPRPVKREYRLTPQTPTVYQNSFGNLITIPVNIESEQNVRQVFRDNDTNERKFREKL